ncbi:hypothetical protein JVT61DRAFT_7488 [Boletus reticuloceps]|uniref:Uncharacterized protein n=1 Tax=Boletus reticuloceps TaxID=495285 RepID=A0A8I2YIX7_9AGAM|nr:hypothetical protein JVT61DRAFT_7488 [Boletus reticuloceps]
MICNAYIGTECLPHQCYTPFLNHLCNLPINHLYHPLHSLKIFLKWVLRWITMLAYCLGLTRLITEGAIADKIVPLLFILILVLLNLCHKIHKFTSMLSIFNMRWRTRDISKFSKNRNIPIS